MKTTSRRSARSGPPTIGIRELRDKLSATLARVREGETVTVTDRNRPIALIVPAGRAGDEQLVRELAGTGRLSWSGGKPRGSRRPPVVRGAPVSDAVMEDRR